jgi:prenyltransferase beta subunit
MRYPCFCLLAALAASFSLQAGQKFTKADAEAVAKKAVAWFSQEFENDGTFKGRAGKSVGSVALAMQALLEAPEPPKEVIAKCADWLAKQQRADGAISSEREPDTYATAVAAASLAKLKDPKYKDVLEKAKAFLTGAQLDGEEGFKPEDHAVFGGYGYKKGDNKADLSATANVLDALKEMGVSEDSETFKNAMLFVKRCQDNPETNDAPMMQDGEGSGGFVYRPGESSFGTLTTRAGKEVPKPYGSMTYQGIKSLIFVGVKPDSPELTQARKWIQQNYAVDKHPGGDGTQGYFYYIVSFAKAFAALGMEKVTLEDGSEREWARDLAAHIARLQNEDGSFANQDPKWWENEKVLATAYALQALNLCTKHLKE